MIVSTLEHILTHISLSIVSILITIELRIFLDDEIKKLYDSSERGMLITFLCITGLLANNWIYLGHFPLSDLSESLIFLSWSFALIHSIGYFTKNLKFLSTITSQSTLFTQGFATSGILTKIQKSSILIPALKSEWLIMHVSLMILGYAALLCGSLLSVALMVITVRNDGKFFFKSNNFLFREISYQNKNFFYAINYYKTQLIKELDFWSYQVISLGFIFLTIGILSGAVWANEAWGSYWSWDPKETWAFITWIVFAIYLHTRININLQSTNSAIVASLGFIIIWICYFGVNLVGLGLHSYGSFPSTSN
uniref:Cytochrome c biogenesis protein CcsA n=1 Tax=Cuscuta reflexa TaxID=4129 RepID=CCSA_CUSRE|nr:cytochrome c biogenesis protein [Cuscuta reflexa]A7M9A9.1 RecName: Full=Cytochrome c biogenesis protein CcsA [Cuscuta reflexa]CAM98437.1 cytochrome c biogenesis protein [Cuscuta reflexa]